MRLVLFVAASACLAFISKASLIRPRSHGFYRFFAWEAMLVLGVLNVRSVAEWFADPLRPRQIASWLLLTASIVPVVWGTYLLRSQGRANTGDERPLYEFEKTTHLVTTGVFGYIRHPMYSSLLLLTWGVFLKRPSAIGAGLGLCATALLFTTAKVEELENRKYFGAPYDAYIQRSSMFLPYVF